MYSRLSVCFSSVLLVILYATHTLASLHLEATCEFIVHCSAADNVIIVVVSLMFTLSAFCQVPRNLAAAAICLQKCMECPVPEYVRLSQSGRVWGWAVQ